MASYRFPVYTARRMPDPILPGAERHIFACPAAGLPDGLSKDPNPRDQRTDRGIYRDVANSLLNVDCTPNVFHLKNKGITLLAREVRKVSDSEYEVEFGQGHGILDGGHTYDICLLNRERIEEHNKRIADPLLEDESSVPINQFVTVNVLTGIPKDLIPEVAGGLNTSVQVQEFALQNLDGSFDWIKDELRNEPYLRKIAFRQNEKDTALDIRDILVLLDLFNTTDFPNSGNNHPIRAYTSKQAVLDTYVKAPESFKRLRPILKDILRLHDIINIESRRLHNELGGKAGNLSFVEDRGEGRTFEFVFLGKQDRYRLTRGALFPMLAAFRWMVTENSIASWRGGFPAVYQLWQRTGGELMRSTQETSISVGRNPNAIGKSRNHWSTLHKSVAFEQVTSTAK